LIMSLVGVILLFRFGMPYGMRTGGGLVLTTEPRPDEAKREGREAPKSLDEVDPEILRTYEKLGIPLREQELLAGVVHQADGWEGGGRLGGC
jgi:Fe-S cluster assembly scaffold protein SufB